MYINHIKQNIFNIWSQIEILIRHFNDAGFNDHRVWMENVAKILLTCIFDANFVNLNKETPNAKGFDLHSKQLDILVQVTTSSKLSSEKETNFNNNSTDNNTSNKFILLYFGEFERKRFNKSNQKSICTFIDLVQEICNPFDDTTTDYDTTISLFNLTKCYNLLEEILNRDITPNKYISYMADAIKSRINKISYFNINDNFVYDNTEINNNLYLYKSNKTLILGYYTPGSLKELLIQTDEIDKEYFVKKLQITIDKFTEITNFIFLNLNSYQLNKESSELNLYTDKTFIEKRLADDSYLRTNLSPVNPHQSYFILNSIKLCNEIETIQIT
ncbi:MAG: SMEK domain-containing protein [Saprospiraceae bacterium]|jgi:hypothetical protein|nr:SMEK domain-containing protein [Saprospiraceae bacterium]